MGDGEMDEPESLGAITLASREQLENLIFVVNCNLQRLDGPVRGNGKIVQELEAAFRGAGWNVLKVLWGDDWDPLLEKDKDGLLARRLGELVDGQMQRYTVSDGAYIRQDVFGGSPELLDMVENYSDEQIRKMRRGGHDPEKVYAAYKAAVRAPRLAHGHPGPDHQGLRPGRGGRGQEHHPPAEEAERAGAARVPEPLRHPHLRRGAERGALLQAARGQRGDEVPPRAPGRAGGLRPPQDRGPHPHGGPARGPLRRVRRGHGGPRGGHHHGLRPPPRQAPEGPEPGQAHRAHRARRGAHLRHGEPLPAGGDLRPPRAALRPGRQGHPALLQGGQGRGHPGGGNHRGGGHVLLRRGGHGLRHPRPPHHPLLHLLLHVRLPARGRPHLGRRGHALARLHPGRHRRAGRPSPARGSSTRTGTATPWPSRCPTCAPTIPPTATSWRSSCATASGACA